MKFKVSSVELLEALNLVSRAISTRSPLPITHKCLLTVSSDNIEIMTSNQMATIITNFTPQQVDGTGSYAFEPQRVQELLKISTSQQIEMVHTDSLGENNTGGSILIYTDTGEYSIPAINGADFPRPHEIEDGYKTIKVQSSYLFSAINTALVAAPKHDYISLFSNILLEVDGNTLSFMTTNTHKLSIFKQIGIQYNGDKTQLLIPIEAVKLLKPLLPLGDKMVKVLFFKNVMTIKTERGTLIINLAQGVWPNVRNIIPKTFPYSIQFDRQKLLGALKRVGMIAEKNELRITMKVLDTEMRLEVDNEDLNFQGWESIQCESNSPMPLKVCYSLKYLQEILKGFSSNDLLLRVETPNTISLFSQPIQEEHQKVLMLLMPLRSL